MPQTQNEIDMIARNLIIGSFVFFALFIGTLVAVCMREDISLVSPDYYKQELAYQDQIKKINNTAGLAIKPSVEIVDGNLIIEFDKANLVEGGEVLLFCPSNSKMDRTYKLMANETPSQKFDLEGLNTGMYRVKLSWRVDGNEYYQEDVIYL